MLQSTRKEFKLVSPTYDTTQTVTPKYCADFGDVVEDRGIRMNFNTSLWSCERGEPEMFLDIIFADNADSNGFDSNFGIGVLRRRCSHGFSLPELRKFIDELNAMHADVEALTAHYAKKKADKEKE